MRAVNPNTAEFFSFTPAPLLSKPIYRRKHFDREELYCQEKKQLFQSANKNTAALPIQVWCAYASSLYVGSNPKLGIGLGLVYVHKLGVARKTKNRKHGTILFFI
jgi:hypothetical protein